MRWVILAAMLLMSGCATDPLSQLETSTPSISPSQLRELQKHVQPFTQTQFNGSKTVTVPLVRIPSDDPRAPYRVPVILATLNGKANVRVLLDSGSNRNLFGYSLARELAIPLAAGMNPVGSHGIGGAVDNYLAVVPAMQVGALEWRNLEALIGPDAQALSLTRSFWNHQQAMIVGLNTLANLSYLTIDNRHGTVTFGMDAYSLGTGLVVVTSAPFQWVGGLPVVELMLEKQWSYRCVLDTGGDYGLLIPRGVAKLHGYWKPGSGKVDASSGVAGAALVTGYEVHEAKLGEATLLKIPARTTLTGPEPAGGELLLGNVVLRRYRVTFDFKNNVLWLER